MKAKDEIKILIAKSGKSYQWLSDRTGIPFHKLYYAVNNSSDAHDIDLDYYVTMMNAFEKEGIIGDGKIACNSLIELSFRGNSTIGRELKKLNDEISGAIADGKFKPDEKKKLRPQLIESRNELMKIFDALINLTEGVE